MKGIIKTESEGVFENRSFDQMLDYMHTIAETSACGHDFAQNCSQGLTDETNGLECEDSAKLEEWYYRVYLKS